MTGGGGLVPPRPGAPRGEDLGRRVEALERAERARAEFEGRILKELAELGTAIKGGLGKLSARIDRVHEDIDGEVRDKLDSMSTEVEASAQHLLSEIDAEADEREKLAIVVGKLRLERGKRKDAERHSIRVQADAVEKIEAEKLAATERIAAVKKVTKRRSSQLVAALLAAATAMGTVIGDKIVARWGTPAPIAADGGRP